jgi:copper chaperone CopZ
MTITLNVDGMTCNGCVQNVTRLLTGVHGVTRVNVTLAPGRAVVETDGTVAAERLIETVEGAGYEARAGA